MYQGTIRLIASENLIYIKSDSFRYVTLGVPAFQNESREIDFSSLKVGDIVTFEKKGNYAVNVHKVE